MRQHRAYPTVVRGVCLKKSGKPTRHGRPDAPKCTRLQQRGPHAIDSQCVARSRWPAPARVGERKER
eukprot:5551736-Pleurochrysis_carterae.AAC.2